MRVPYFLAILQASITVSQLCSDAVFLGDLAGFDNGFAALLGQGSVDAAGVQPAHAQLAEDVFKVKVLGLGLGDGGVGAVGAAHGAADAEAALGEVQAVAAQAADAVRLLPADQAGVHAALLDQVLEQLAHFVVGCIRRRLPRL